MKVLIGALLSALALFGCSNSQSEEQDLTRAQTIVPPKQLSGDDVGSDRYEDSEPEFAGVESTPTPTSDGEVGATGDAAGSDAESLLADQADVSDCLYVGDLAIEYSKLSEQQDGSASITQILDTRVLDDWSQTASIPPEGEKEPVIRCWARVRWSIGAESDVDLWLLIDSNGDARVRWDNIQNVVEEVQEM